MRVHTSSVANPIYWRVWIYRCVVITLHLRHCIQLHFQRRFQLLLDCRGKQVMLFSVCVNRNILSLLLSQSLVEAGTLDLMIWLYTRPESFWSLIFLAHAFVRVTSSSWLDELGIHGLPSGTDWLKFLHFAVNCYSFLFLLVIIREITISCSLGKVPWYIICTGSYGIPFIVATISISY